MELDGTAVVRCAAPDVGGGQTSSLCSITAEILGLPLEQVTAVGRDSHFTPRAGTTTATRQLFMSGNAVLKAASEVRRHLVGPGGGDARGRPRGHRAGRRRGPWCAARRIAPCRFSVVVKAATAAGRPVQVLDKYDAPSAPTIDPATGQGKPFNDYTFGTQAVEVEVDEETGQTRVTKLAACYDIGQAINRQSAEGQIEGGAIQGLGHALLEEVILEDGVSKNPHLLDYKIPTTLDAPPVVTILLESGQGLGPFGAKGIGEPAMTPTPAAVMNAVSRAAGVPSRSSRSPPSASSPPSEIPLPHRGRGQGEGPVVPHFEERFTVNAPPDTVWAFLLDPKRLAPCIPGCDDLEIVDERVYRLRLTVKVGFLSTRQDVRMEIVEADPPRRLVSEGRGEDTRLGSRVEVRNSLELSPADHGATTVAYASDVTVLGRLGSIGDAVMKVKAKELAGLFAQNVKSALEPGNPSPPPGERAG